MSTLRRVVRLAAIVVAGLVASVLMLYLIVNVGAVVAARAKRSSLGDEVTRRIAEELPASRQRADSVAGSIPSEPNHSWVAQRCEFETNDSGWIVREYRQVCALESAHAWQVDSRAEADRLLGDLASANEPPSTYGSCTRYAVSPRFREQNLFGESRLELIWSEPESTGARWCLPSADGYQARRSVVAEVPELDPAHGWLVVMQTDELVDEVIGCAHWSVIFCDNPFGDELAWGTPPT
ncbi:hypothetical protein LL946_01105 [Knoellia locipacati]|uniref:hypothetical protein n=1 Tax=Knoellia locipacati TaxID=882824 RepID=UPI0038513A9A